MMEDMFMAWAEQLESRTLHALGIIQLNLVFEDGVVSGCWTQPDS